MKQLDAIAFLSGLFAKIWVNDHSFPLRVLTRSAVELAGLTTRFHDGQAVTAPLNIPCTYV